MKNGSKTDIGRLRKASVALLCMGLAAVVWAVQSPVLELGAGGDYDGTVKIERDDSGRMVFRDHDNSAGITLESLRTRAFDHGELTGLADNDHPQYILHTQLDTESELEGALTDVGNVYTNNDGNLDDDNLSNNTTDDLPEGTGHLYFTGGRVAATNAEAMHTAGASGTAPVSNGSGGLVMTDIATQAELNAHNHDAAYVNVGGDTMTGALSIGGTLGVDDVATFNSLVNIAGIVTLLDDLDVDHTINCGRIDSAGSVKGSNLVLGPSGTPNSLRSYDTNGDIYISPLGTGITSVSSKLDVTPTSGTSFAVGGTHLRVVNGQTVAGAGSWSSVSGSPQLLAVNATDARLGAVSGTNKAAILRYNTGDDCGSVFAYDYNASTAKKLRLDEFGGGVAVGGTTLTSGSAMTVTGKMDATDTLSGAGLISTGSQWRDISVLPYAFSHWDVVENDGTGAARATDTPATLCVPMPYAAGTIATGLRICWDGDGSGANVTVELLRSDGGLNSSLIAGNTFATGGTPETYTFTPHTMLADNAYWIRVTCTDPGALVNTVGIQTSKRVL